MLTDILLTLFERDLNRLKDEINAYTNEALLWKVQPGISNSAGNLTLHLIGNLSHFVGAILGNSGYVRERDKEFSLKDIPRAQLLASIDEVLDIVKSTLGRLTDADMEKIYTANPGKTEQTTGLFLTHLTAHLNYHLGQINYHRRLIGSAQ